MTKKKALGRGLSALLKESKNINSASDENAKDWIGTIIEVPLNKIVTNPYQPREYFDESALEDLSKSISELGVIQPITVRKKGSKFELISGERRFRASTKAGLKSIPAYVRIANDQEMLEMALVENIQREDLDAIEVALSYQRLLDEIKLTQEELSKRIGKNRSSITNYLRLLKLDPVIQTGIREDKISMGHGRALLAVENAIIQQELFDQIVKDELSVRQTEQIIQREKEKGIKKSHKKPLPNHFKKTKEELKSKLNTPIEISRSNNGKGKIVLTFSSDKDFDRICNLLR